ncbi:MerR family transcriptional regulator [Bacillus wiedmannii]|uniref:MerR family transcriptional regulator n=2 Tax=Bacillus wiedmannii TaxID=1890302 RepID=A0A4U2MGN5_9BACI|nr:MerR family transcriptional regulator [Bacillus wiedmannii]TKH09908.1 MerR family transcriptional regulator [Bacillus wiedmannii]
MSNNKKYSIGEFSAKTGTSIRTLHYYDEIGLLKAEKQPSSGHRQYNDQDVLTLQKIVSFKFLGYSLEQIGKMMKESSFNSNLNDTLQKQKKAFEQKKEQIETTLNAINRTIELIAGEGEVDSPVLMSLINSMQIEKDQRLCVEQHISKDVADQLFNKPKEELVALDKEFIQLSKEVKRLMGKSVHDPEVQELVDKHMKATFEFVGEEAIYAMQDLEDLEKEKLENMFSSPYTKEEEEWLNQAMEYYMIQNGMYTPKVD